MSYQTAITRSISNDMCTRKQRYNILILKHKQVLQIKTVCHYVLTLDLMEDCLAIPLF